jgi:23S rRNA (cytosine1962-C5)-methyltransferase
LDQVDNRRYLQSISSNKSVLNCFAYTGSFGVAALRGGATHVVNVDSSAPALQVAEQNMQLNGFEQDQFENVVANVFELLREYKRENRRFDIVILDPPKLAETKTQQQKAARAYKDMALQAASVIAPGGYLINFSCSGAMDMGLFQKITADAFLDAKRQGQVIRYLHQSGDHPVALPFPESLYLKGLVCQVE